MPISRVPDVQCHDLCVQKHGNNGPSVLLVSKNNTKSIKSSLEGFSWDAIIGEMQESWAPGLVDFIYAVSVVLLKIY